MLVRVAFFLSCFICLFIFKPRFTEGALTRSPQEEKANGRQF